MIQPGQSKFARRDKEEIRPWLIQRAIFEKREKEGIDGILRFDYMGSSEFEWGALPKALKEIKEHLSEYTYSDVPIKNKIVTLFCKTSDRSEILNILNELAEDQIRLQEQCAFSFWVKDQEKSFYKCDLWWDIGNNYMFWKKNNDFEKEFKQKIEFKKVV